MGLDVPESVKIIDGNYTRPQRAAAYLVVDASEAAFFDTATRFAVPDMLRALNAAGLTPHDVRYILVSHVHLDHSGGTAELAKHCARATILCHPRAHRHLVDPSKLIEAARPIYGLDKFDGLFGEIEPIDESRVRSVNEGERFALGNRTLEVLHTPGHARHHMAIFDPAVSTVFAGDAFGLAQLRLQEGCRVHMSYVCSPPDYSSADAQESIRKIRATGADRVCVAHYGCLRDLDAATEQLFRITDTTEAIINDAAASDLEGEAIERYARDRLLAMTRDELTRCGLDPNDNEILDWATIESPVTRQGIVYMAERKRASAGV